MIGKSPSRARPRQDTWDELERRCRKLDDVRIGNWMARRITRPMALRVTAVLGPRGFSAHSMTCAAWVCGALAAGAFSTGTLVGWLCGAALLQFWYLLDHVDGQLARYHGTASLDGVQLDYLMHHTMNVLVPLGIGLGCQQAGAHPACLLAAVAWMLGLLTLGLSSDTRYKAFVQRLKLVQGCLQVTGGAGGRPSPASSIPRSVLGVVRWTARKSCEIHVIMNLLSLLAVTQWLLNDKGLFLARVYVSCAAITTGLIAMVTTIRSVRQGGAEQEFRTWYRAGEGHELVFDSGWWKVEPARTAKTAPSGSPATAEANQSS